MPHPTAANVTEPRQHLPEYLRRVERGEEIEITSRGRAIARIVPREDPRAEAKALLAGLRRDAFVGDVLSGIEEEWTADSETFRQAVLAARGVEILPITVEVAIRARSPLMAIPPIG